MASWSKYNSEWKGLALQSELPSMGDAVSIGRLIIDSSDMSEGSSESAGARACVVTGDLGCRALDDSLGLEVPALLAGGHRIELSGREVVTPGVVGSLLVSYLRWRAGEEGLVGAPPLEGGICGASVAWNGKSRGTRAEEALCLEVRLSEGMRRVPRVVSCQKWNVGLGSVLWSEMRGVRCWMERDGLTLWRDEVARWQRKMRGSQW